MDVPVAGGALLGGQCNQADGHLVQSEHESAALNVTTLITSDWSVSDRGGTFWSSHTAVKPACRDGKRRTQSEQLLVMSHQLLTTSILLFLIVTVMCSYWSHWKTSALSKGSKSCS